ncbi:MAG: PDZ domain-containing protein [Lachnospiraceae bacterium]|nr:PDZ domain-containing protein [Lachnospiraceae bacterium]
MFDDIEKEKQNNDNVTDVQESEETLATNQSSETEADSSEQYGEERVAEENVEPDTQENEKEADFNSYNENVENKTDAQSNENNYSTYYERTVPQGNNLTPKKGGTGKAVVAVILAIVAALVIMIVGTVAIAEKYISDARTGSVNNEISNSKGNDKDTEKETYKAIESTNTENKSNASSDRGVVITDVSDVVDDVMPSIVAITSTTIVESSGSSIEDWLYGMYGYGSDSNQKQQYEQVGAGSGIIVKQNDNELLIVTNNHVVAGADKLSIQFVNGKSIEAVTKSTDENADIAIVSIPLKDIDEETWNAIKIAELGDSDALKVGDGVIAIGNALGYGQSVTTGVISAKDREIAVDNRKMVVLQTDAAINGGNSGGALLDYSGKVIGINVAKYSSSEYSGSASIEGMGFAIPISQATEIMENLMSRQTRTKAQAGEQGALGIEGTDVDSQTAELYGLPVGIYVKNVIDKAGAKNAGMKSGDIIVEFDGQSVNTMDSLQDKLQYYKAGEKVSVKVMRMSADNYKEVELEVTLSESSVISSKDNNQNQTQLEKPNNNPFAN